MENWPMKREWGNREKWVPNILTIRMTTGIPHQEPWFISLEKHSQF
jgi:hypothetical protein